jgi:hypothetical protein
VDLAKPVQLNRIGTLARFSALLADYESVRRRARPDADVAGEQVGGQDRGTWYYKNLGIHIVNHAAGAYEGFEGEPDAALNAVDLTTVHRAKDATCVADDDWIGADVYENHTGFEPVDRHPILYQSYRCDDRNDRV